MSERVASSIVESLARLEALQKAQRERDEYKKLYTHLREENERLKRGLLGKKAEKLPQNDAQLSLAILGLMLGGGEEPAPPPADEEPTRVIPEHTRKVPKRRGPSDDWPRVLYRAHSSEVEREGLDAFDIIGQETRGVLERRPCFLRVRRGRAEEVRAQSRQAALETSVFIADPLPLPIAKGIAGPGLLAETIVKRWCDHQAVASTGRDLRSRRT